MPGKKNGFLFSWAVLITVTALAMVVLFLSFCQDETCMVGNPVFLKKFTLLDQGAILPDQGPGTVPICGNRLVEAGEQCDDGNPNQGDGCESCKSAYGSPVIINTTVNEPSGIIWHEGRQKFYLVDDGGYVWSMNKDGTGAESNYINPWQDLEAVTITNPSSDFIYLVRERTSSVPQTRAILEYNLDSETVTRTFGLTNQEMVGTDNLGPEALAFIPNAFDPEGGLFYVGKEGDSKIYKYRLSIQSSASSTDAVFLGTMGPWPGTGAFKDMYYDTENGILYAFFSNNVLLALTKHGQELYRWTSPQAIGNDEGICLLNGNFYITLDPNSWGAVYRVPFAGIQKPANGGFYEAE